MPLAAALVVIAPYLYLHLDSHLRRHVSGVLAGAFPDYHVDLSEAQWLPGRGLRLRGVSLKQRDAGRDARETVFVDEMFLHTKADLADLALGDKQVRRITLQGLRLTAVQRADGSWSTAGLWPLPELGGKPEQIDVLGARVAVVTADANGRNRSLELQDVDFTALRQPGADLWRIDAHASAAWCDSIQAVAVVDEAGGASAIKVAATGLAWNKEIAGRLPPTLAVKLRRANELAAEFNVEAGAKFDLSGGLRDWRAKGSIRNGSYSPSQLATPIHELQLAFQAGPAGGSVSGARGSFGDASLHGDATWSAGGDFSVEGGVEQLVVTDGLLDALGKFSPEAVQLKEDYRPRGLVDVEFALERAAGRESKRMSAVCRDVSVVCRQFPYPVDHVVGSVQWTDGRLTAALDAVAASQPIRIDAKVFSPGDNGYGTVRISGRAIPVSDELLAALKEDPRREIQRLHPRGDFDFVYQLEKPTPEASDRNYLRLEFRDGAVNHEAFPYPLTGVQGVVEAHDDLWTIGAGRPLVAEAGDGVVRCRGVIAPNAETRGAAPLLRLAFAAERVAIDNRLYEALPSESRARWDELRPSGDFDFEADFVLENVQAPPQLEVRGKLGNYPAAVHPKFFPYRLDRLVGDVAYRDGKTTWDRLQAAHGETVVSCGGRAETTDAGRVRIVLKDLMLDWSGRDRDLIDAFPPRLRDAIAALNPRGLYQVAGAIELQPETAFDPFFAAWSLNIDAAQAALSAGVELTNVYGRLEQFSGRVNGDAFSTKGRLTASSVDYWGHQFSRVDGPIECNAAGVRIGLPQTARSSADPLRAELYDGVVEAFATYEWGSQHYAVQAKVDNADLGRLAVEHLPGRQSLLGKADATLNLQGTGFAVAGVEGGGAIHLRNADIYELPVMVSTLKLLSVRPPDATAFTESRIDYAIQGSTIRFPKIEFYGDAVSLTGDGAMRLPDQIDLVFSARLGRRPAPLVGRLLDGAGETWRLMPVRVHGSLYDPDVTIEAFPGFADALAPATSDRNGPASVSGGRFLNLSWLRSKSPPPPVR